MKRARSGAGARSAPRLPADRLVVLDDCVMKIEGRVAVGVVGAQVCAAALSARKRALGDQACQRVLGVEQPAQPLLGAHDPRVAPQRFAQGRICELGRRVAVCVWIETPITPLTTIAPQAPR